MHQRLFVALLFCSLWSTLCSAIDTSSLPLIGDKFPFTVVVTGDAAITTPLNEELRKQRKQNWQRKQLSSAEKIARFEKQLLLKRLQAEGYYDGDVAFQLDDKRITYHVNTGPRYIIQQIDLDLPEGLTVPMAVLGLKANMPLRAEEVLKAQQSLQNYVAENYCLRDIETDYQALLQSEQHRAALRFTLADSPSVTVGTIRFQGLKSIDEDYLLARLPIEKGECFKRKKIDAARVSLVKSNLLANVTASIGEANAGTVDITLHAKERRHRTVSAGLSFQTDNGLGLNLGWENRNMWHRAQRLRFDGQLNEIQQSIALDLTLPHFLRDQQSVTLFAEVNREDTNAFLSTNNKLGAEISRPFWLRELRVSAGGEVSFVEDQQEDISYALVSLPLRLEFDRRNDALDPTKGWVVSSQFRPFWEAYDKTHFTKSTLALSAYHTFAKQRWRPTIALRTAAGSIDGADRPNTAEGSADGADPNSVPTNLLFYVGGGGSVRGYAFQTLGPLDGTTPLGGLSFSDYSAELRLRWGENWGAVWFIDGGFAYRESSPQVGENLHWATGLGLRYFTSFAPIRFDVAVPLNRRAEIDDPFQVYISIGQAF